MKLNMATKTGLMSATALVSAAQVVNADSDRLYFGLSASGISGEFPIITSDDYIFNPSQVTLGAFAGINFPGRGSGRFYGLEIAVNMEANAGPDYPDYVATMIDTKFRLGTALGTNSNIEVYGFAGLSGGIYNDTSGYDYYNGFFGTNLGVGADIRVNDRMKVGIEAIHRILGGYNYDETGSFNSTQVSLRAIFDF